jgi:glycosyltransferase involved in cell wall biosynthesis
LTRQSLPEQAAPDSGGRETYTFVIRSLHAGGAERQLALIACALAADGHDVELITFYAGGEFEPEVRRCGVNLSSLGKSGRWDLVGFGTRLVRTLRRSGGGVVVGFLEGANIILAVLRPLLDGRKVVNRLASTYMDLGRYDWLSGWSFGAELRFAKRADLVIANSSAGVERALKAGVANDKLAMVPNAVDGEWFKPDEGAASALRDAWGVAAGDRVVGIVGRLDPMKDHANFVAAAEIVLQRRPGVIFVCVGGGSDPAYTEEIRCRAGRLVEQGRFLFLGFRSDLPGIYSALDVNVLSSYGEGSPNSIIESMACGTTCVVTDVGDARKLVGGTGTVVPARDAQQLAEGILLQLEMISVEPGLGATARDTVLAEHSVQSCVRSFRTALASIS